MTSTSRTTWRFSTAGEILFGQHAAQQIGAEARFRNLSRAFIITDPNMVKAGLVDIIRASLDQSQIAVEVFDGGVPEPGTRTVNAATDAARAFKPDCIVGLGGGSNMDVAKAAAVVFTHGGSAINYIGENKVPAPVVPLIAVPTTAGTGSEVTAVAVIEDEAKQLKLAVSSPFVQPALAIVDPLLTLSCPPKVTAESGMDALCHAVESFVVISYAALDVPATQRLQFTGKNPAADALAEKAIRLIGANLRKAVYQPANVQAREAMHLAAMLAGMAFNSAGLGAAHSLQYPVGAVTHTPHGLGTGLLLPYVCRFLLPAVAGELADVAAWLGENVEGMSDADAAAVAIEAIQSLKHDVGLPMRLSAIGVDESHLKSMAEQAATYQRLNRSSARPLTAPALEGILRDAL